MASVWIQQAVELVIEGPVLTAGETFSSWGMDTSFYLDFNGNPALPGSHVRGKLKEAFIDVLLLEGESDDLVNMYFGKQSHKKTGYPDSYFPHRGMLKVTDFTLKKETIPHDQVKTCIRIEPETGIVSPGALMVSEMPFPSGKQTHWHGLVEFFSTSEKIDLTLDYLFKAFLFITAMGRNKTAGYGRLTKVYFKETKQAAPDIATTREDYFSGIEIAIVPEEIFMIGGVRHTENVFKSESIIPGKVLKGALAAGLNRLAGNTNLNKIIDATNKKVSAMYPELSKSFGELIMNHAVPCLEKFRRPYTIPLSGVIYGNEYKEITFTNPTYIFAKTHNPVTFQVDWKKNPETISKKYDKPDLEFFPVTRTAIETKTRNSDEAKLYSFHMVKPVINGSTQVYWNSKILLPSHLEPDQQRRIIGQLRAALPLGLKYIGKRQSRACVFHQPIKPSSKLRIKPGSKFAVILQTQALLIDPEKIAESRQSIFDHHERLHNLYQDYWETVFGHGTVELNHFYAAQELQGGYLGVRFMQKQYSPFYLTSQGSVFVLKSCNEKINTKINELLNSGLPIPEWVKHLNNPHHPFAPQSGYGEIIIEKGEKE